jgi:hypothetical protein
VKRGDAGYWIKKIFLNHHKKGMIAAELKHKPSQCRHVFFPTRRAILSERATPCGKYEWALTGNHF